MSRQQRSALVSAAVVVAALAFILLRPSDDSSDQSSSKSQTQTQTRTSTGATTAAAPTPSAKPRPRSVRARIYGGKPAGGIAHLTVKKGEAVVVNVTSPNTTDEVHVHGYDLHGDLAPGEPVKIAFKAKIEGIFEVELEGSKTQIIELKVEP
jgi:hypothetical protein